MTPAKCVSVCVCVCVFVFVSLNVIRCNDKPLHLQGIGRRGPTTEGRKEERNKKERKKGHKLISDIPSIAHEDKSMHR